MARPLKQGLDYFSFDVDFFDNRKIKKIMRACGPASGSILTCLLCFIYQNKGYYIVWDEDLPFDIADKVGVSEGAVAETVKKAVQVEFFSRYQFEKNNILTSEEILKRYKAGTATRKEVVINSDYTVFSINNRVIDVQNEIKDTDNPQSKVKERKGKNLAGEPPTHSGKSLEQREKDFYDQLATYLGIYTKEMLREFYDYWREPNKSKTKMKWEQERTWDLSLRLKRWAANDKNFKGTKQSPAVVPLPVGQLTAAELEGRRILEQHS